MRWVIRLYILEGQLPSVDAIWVLRMVYQSRGIWEWSPTGGQAGPSSNQQSRKSWVSKSSLKLVWKILMKVKEQPGAGLGKVVFLRSAPDSVPVWIPDPCAWVHKWGSPVRWVWAIEAYWWLHMSAKDSSPLIENAVSLRSPWQEGDGEM